MTFIIKLSNLFVLCGNVGIEVCVVFWPQSPGPVDLRSPNHPHDPRRDDSVISRKTSQGIVKAVQCPQFVVDIHEGHKRLMSFY